MNQLLTDKVPPQALDLEQAILGAIMIEKDALSIVLDILRPETFYRSEHEIIYSACLELFNKSHPIDMLTVTEQLKLNGQLNQIGGAVYIVELTNKVGSAANIEYHARIISQKYIQRELIRLGQETISRAWDESNDVLELMEETEKAIYNLGTNQTSRDFRKLSKISAETLKQMESVKDSPGGITGVGTGIHDLDKLTAGWQPSDFIIIAARPGMGKTSFVLSVARNAARLHKKRVAIFSLEMSGIQLDHRMIAMDTGISVSRIRNANLDPDEWGRVSACIEANSKLGIFVDDTPGLNIYQLRSKARRLKMKEDIDLVIIDYLQLMSSKEKYGRNREQEVSEISRQCKILAKELNVPVLALSQLSRAVEIRGGSKRPQLSDLRESGSLEQDADAVIFIYRPEYYDMTEDEEGNSLIGVAEVIFAKHRNGKLDTIFTRFIHKTTEFVSFGETETDNYNPVIPAGRIDEDEEMPF